MNNLTKTLTALITATALISCASQNPQYQRADDQGDVGYSESQLTENRYRVSYTGSRTEARDAVKDFALLRAAELTLLNGHEWFKVNSADTTQESRSTPQATTSVQTGNRVYRDCGLLGCSTTVAPAYSTVEVRTSRDSSKFVSSIEIVMGKGEVANPTDAYNASELRAFIEGKYDG